MKRMFLNKVPDCGTGMPAVSLHQTQYDSAPLSDRRSHSRDY